MPEYKFYKLENGDRIAGRSFIFTCKADQQAVVIAELLAVAERDVEVCQGGRHVTRIKACP